MGRRKVSVAQTNANITFWRNDFGETAVHTGGASPQTRDVDAAGGMCGVTRTFLRPLRGLREEWVVSLGVPLRSTPSYVPVPPSGRNIGTGGVPDQPLSTPADTRAVAPPIAEEPNVLPELSPLERAPHQRASARESASLVTGRQFPTSW